jgi:hypothetical protein
MPQPEYAEPLPDGCPPADARHPSDGEAFYRLVSGDPPAGDDFDSHTKKGLAGGFAHVTPCELSSCSLWDSFEGAKRKRKRPGSKIAKVVLNSTAGKIKQTFGPGHFSWWVATDFDPFAHAIIVETE